MQGGKKIDYFEKLKKKINDCEKSFKGISLFTDTSKDLKRELYA